MFCSKCGSPVNEGEKFCSVCGQQVETVETQQSLAQPSVQQPSVQQPYGQQPYGQPPYNNAYNNAPRKSKKGLLITVTLVAVLAIAAVAVFLWPGLLTSSAGTMQMKFISDNGQVFEDAFKGLGSQSDADMAEKPFDMTMSMNIDISGVPSQKFDMEMAYDQETLGLSEDIGVTQLKMLLLNDVLYVNAAGQTTGIRFSSDADLSKPMTLKERMTAILNGLMKDLGGNLSDTKVDWEKLLVMMVNSIDKSNFKQSGSATTLTLDPDAIISTMKTFRDSLSKDKGLLKDLESFIKGTSGQETDVLKALDDAIKNMEDTKDSADFEITWTVNYEGGKPVSIDLSADSAGQNVEITFGYKNTDSGKDISFAIDTPGDSSDVTADFSYEKNGSKTDFTGTINAAGQTVNISGTGTQNGNDIEGSMTVEAAGQTVNLTYDGTMKYGAPSTKVKDDSRFKIDTEGVTVYNISEFAGLLSSGMLSGISTNPETSIIPETSSSPESSSSITWIDLEGVWETSGGTALLFKDGSVYAGLSGASVDDILNDTAGVRGTKDGTFYMITGDTLTIYNLDGSTVDYNWDGTNLWSKDGTEYVPRADATVNTY